MSDSHRKLSAKIRIVDESGKAITRAIVKYKLTNHEFLFGCGAFDFVPYCTDMPADLLKFFTETKTANRGFYEERCNRWLELFNYGTLPFYWAGYEPQEGNVQHESRMNAAKYLQDNGRKVKGHPLCWHTECADWLMKYDNKTIMDKQLARINRDVGAFKGVIDMWDVINETVIMPVYDRYDNAVSRICKEYGRLTLIKEVFDAAHAANPDAVLLINDFNLSEDYRKVIDECLEHGVPISAIGIQSHQHQGYKGMDWMNDVIDRFKVFDLPLHFTENTLVSGQIMPAHIVDLNDYQVDSWPTTPDGEERQSREWVEMYTRVWEEPLVEAITGWDFADGAWLHAPSGLVREDNSPKPSFENLKELVHNKWTSSGEAVTDDNGTVTIEGYRGEYELTINGKPYCYNLTKSANSTNDIIMLKSLR